MNRFEYNFFAFICVIFALFRSFGTEKNSIFFFAFIISCFLGILLFTKFVLRIPFKDFLSFYFVKRIDPLILIYIFLTTVFFRLFEMSSLPLYGIDYKFVPYDFDLINFIILSLIIPIIEEVTFRFSFFVFLKEYIPKYRHFYFIYNMLFFILIHLNFSNIFSIFNLKTIIIMTIFTVITFYLFFKTKNLLYSILFHIFFNLGYFLFSLKGDYLYRLVIKENNTVFNGLSSIIFLFISFFFLFLINKKYKNEKLDYSFLIDHYKKQ